MRRPGGYLVISDPDAPLKEMDTVTCGHCQRVVLVGAKQDPSQLGGFCRSCFTHVCPRCNATGVCTPFEKKLEEYEKRTARRDSLFRSMGLV
jgi:hypothetical protein